MSTPGTIIQNYLLLHLSKEFPGLDVWRANVVGRKPGVSIVAAGEPGQADLTGVWGGRCVTCFHLNGTDVHSLYFLDQAVHPFTPSGRSVWIEVKASGDSQSKTQMDFERRVTRLGALYIICRVRKKETVSHIQLCMEANRRDKTSKQFTHSTEIADFFAELRSKL